MQVLHEPEIEEHDTSRRCDQDVGGLDVPMELARLVERVEPFGQLSQRPAEPIHFRERDRLVSCLFVGGCSAVCLVPSGPGPSIIPWSLVSASFGRTRSDGRSG